MRVSFKNMSNKVIKYEVNQEDTLKSVVSKIFEENKTDSDNHAIKFIYKGQILNHDKPFSEFTEPNPNIIYMITKNKPVVAPSTQTVQPVVVQPTQPVHSDQPTQQLQTTSNVNSYPNLFAQQIQEDDNDDLDSVDQLRSAVMGVLVFVRANPQLAELFNNNFETLLGVMASPQIKPLFEKMVGETGDGNSDYLDELSSSLLNVNSGEQLESSTSQSQSMGQSQANSIQLTQQDMDNINTLVSLGFDKQNVIQAYIVCNKNLDMAASMLMDSQH
jgi:UV excision repair protein RAD23